MSFGDWWNTNVAGTVSDQTYDNAPQVTAIPQSTYQIPGIGDYQNQLGGLSNQAGQASQQAQGQLQGLQSGPIPQQQQALQSYLQSVAMGQAPSAADQMLQNSQGTAARQMQSAMVGAGGMNPALAMRQMFNAQASNQANVAGQAAQQKLQEQQAFGGLAQRGAAQLYQQQLTNAQSQFHDQMATNQAQTDIANGIFGANRAQTNYNVEAAQNQQAFQTFQRAQYLQHAQDMATAHARLGHAIINGGLTVAGGVAGLALSGGNPMGAMAGAGLGSQLGGALTGGGGGGNSSGLNTAMMALMAQGRGGGDGGGGAGGMPTQIPGSNGVPINFQDGAWRGVTSANDYSGYTPPPLGGGDASMPVG